MAYSAYFAHILALFRFKLPLVLTFHHFLVFVSVLFFIFFLDPKHDHKLLDHLYYIIRSALASKIMESLICKEG